VFPRARLAVFLDGCFWHGCPEHGRVPGGPNADYWSEKLARNQARDKDDSRLLEASGWTVLRIWEHVSVDEAADKVELALRS
jgi:DNA mismatch endonuclease (patch repair protein)